MGKKKQNSVAAASKAKKDFKQRLATANVSNKISKANSKFKSTKPVVKNLKKIVNETRGKVTSTNVDFDNLQSQVYSAKKVQAPVEKKRDSFEKLRQGRDGVSDTDMEAALAQFNNFYPLAAMKKWRTTRLLDSHDCSPRYFSF